MTFRERFNRYFCRAGYHDWVWKRVDHVHDTCSVCGETRTSPGVTPELRKAFEFYRNNYKG